MAATDARPVPIKNQAFRVTFPIYDADGDLVTGAASLDSEVSKDQATYTDCTNEATEIATASGTYYLDLTSTEMNADNVSIIVKTGTAGAKTTFISLYPQEAGDIKADVQSINGSTAAAVVQAILTGTLVAQGTVTNAGFTPTATEFEAGDITEATADHFIGKTVYPTSGALIFQAATITDYALSSGRGHFTIAGFASGETIANAVTFVIV